MEQTVTLMPIGRIRTPFTALAGMPVQPGGARGTLGRLELDPELAPGLADLDGFSHIYLIYCFHASKGYDLTVTPYLDDTPRGLFATRAPRRPNPIGLSVVELVAVDDGVHVNLRELRRLIAATDRIVASLFICEVCAAADRNALLPQRIGELVDERRAGVRLELVVAVALHLADKDSAARWTAEEPGSLSRRARQSKRQQQGHQQE